MRGNHFREEGGGDLAQGCGILIKVAWRKDMRLSRKTASGLPTCILDSGAAGVSALQC